MGEQDPKRKYPNGTRIEIDENGRRIVIFPQVARARIGIDNRLKGKEITKGQRYIRKDGHTS